MLVSLSIFFIWSWIVKKTTVLDPFYAKNAKISSNYLKMSRFSSRNVWYPRYQDTAFLQLCSEVAQISEEQTLPGQMLPGQMSLWHLSCTVKSDWLSVCYNIISNNLLLHWLCIHFAGYVHYQKSTSIKWFWINKWIHREWSWSSLLLYI